MGCTLTTEIQTSNQQDLNIEVLPKSEPVRRSGEKAENSVPVDISQPPLSPIIAGDTDNGVQHVVQESDTMSSVCNMYGVRAEDLMRVNRLHSKNLRFGQVLKIPPPTL